MRVVFMGTPEFAVPSLRALAASHDVVAAYTQPDRPRKRGKSLVPSPVKLTALELGIPVAQPGTLREPGVSGELARLAPDVICVAAFGMIVPREILAIPPHGCLNVHASLLPRHRGAAPIHRAILEGDPVAGVVIMQMEEGLDTGPFAHSVTVPVADLDVASLSAILAEEGARALLATLADIECGTAAWTPQDDEGATYAEKITPADVALHPDLEAAMALRRIRASSPSASSRVHVAGTDLEVLSALADDLPLAPGVVRAEKHGLYLGLRDGAIKLGRVKPAGRGEMDAAAFARGASIPADATWTAAA